MLPSHIEIVFSIAVIFVFDTCNKNTHTHPLAVHSLLYLLRSRLRSVIRTARLACVTTGEYLQNIVFVCVCTTSGATGMLSGATQMGHQFSCAQPYCCTHSHIRMGVKRNYIFAQIVRTAISSNKHETQMRLHKSENSLH
jgi:hypothetical protein